jgi:type IV secretion system protein TrbL
MRRVLGVMAAVLAALLLILTLSPAAHGDPPSDPGLVAACEEATPLPDWACEAAVGAVPGASAVVDAAPVIGGVVDFIQNPLGYLAAGVTGAAIWVMGQVALFANASTQPDLTASFWLDAYRKGLAIGTVLLGIALLLEIVQVARRRASADELIETVAIWVPAWFAGVLFGPALAQFLINGSGFLADGIIHSMTGFSGGDALRSISDAAANAGIGAGLTGAAQAFMALIVGFALFIAAALVYVSLCVQGMIIYLASAVFAIGWVWIVTQRHRQDAWRIPRLFLAIVFSKALLFFLLGICMAIATAATAIQGDGAGRDFALAVTAIIGLLIVAFAPLMLFRHAPVMPGTSTDRERDGVTTGGAARAGRDAGVNAHGLASKGGSKLNALAAARRDRRGSPPPPGAPAGPGRTIDPPPPAGGTSKASGTATPAGGASAPQSGSGSPRPGRPNPASANGQATPRAASGTTSTATNGAARGQSAGRRAPTAGAPRPQSGGRQTPRVPDTRAGGAGIPAVSGERPPTPGAPRLHGERLAEPQQIPDHEYELPSTPPAESAI